MHGQPLAPIFLKQHRRRERLKFGCQGPRPPLRARAVSIKAGRCFNCPGVGCGPSGYSGEIKSPWAWAVGGRAGYLVGPSLLTYWTGGFTQAHFDQVNYSDAQTGVSTGLVLPAQTYAGWYLGGGIEFAFGDYVPGLYWRTEYRFSDYQSRNVSQLCGGGLCGLPGTIHSIDRIHPQEQSIWTALVYRFNWTGAKYLASAGSCVGYQERLSAELCGQRGVVKFARLVVRTKTISEPGPRVWIGQHLISAKALSRSNSDSRRRRRSS
jgi:hypothetical protein